MDDAMVIEMFVRLDDLAKILPGLIFCDFLVRSVSHITKAQLGNDINFIYGFDSLMKIEDMRLVMECLEDFDL